jgi:hypothetical protein
MTDDLPRTYLGRARLAAFITALLAKADLLWQKHIMVTDALADLLIGKEGRRLPALWAT